MTILRGITWDHPRGYDCLVGAAAEYQRAHPDTRIEWTARSLQAFADGPLEAMAADYDLLVIDHPHIPHAHELRLLLPLELTGRGDELEALAAETIGESHASYAHGGHQYGLAIDAAAQVAVYRPDLIGTAPHAWDEVFALAVTGRVLWAAKPVDAISSLMTLAANLGSPVAARAGEFLDRSTGLAAMQLMHRLAEAVPPWCLDANPIEIAEALSGGDEWAYSPLAFGYTNYSRAAYRPHRIAYVDMPRGPGGVAGSCLGGAGIAVSARTLHVDEAVTHAFWLASPDVQCGVYYASGGQPGYASAWDDDAVNADCLDFFRATRATLDQSWLRPRYAGWLEVFEEVGVLVNRALRGELTDDAVLRTAQQVYERSLDAKTGTAR